jgi:hypothetical protein
MARVDRSIPGMNLGRHIAWIIAAALFAALALPVLVYYTGTATLGPYENGGLSRFLGQFWSDVLGLHLSAWTLLLGPVALVTVWRILVAYVWPAPGR